MTGESDHVKKGEALDPVLLSGKQLQPNDYCIDPQAEL